MKLKYLELYAKEFDLVRHIVYGTEVVRVSAADHVSSTRWSVSFRNLETGEMQSEDFDSIMVCTSVGQSRLSLKISANSKAKSYMLRPTKSRTVSKANACVSSESEIVLSIRP